jgi:dihydrolipoamide dehydrogenase
VVRTRTAHYPGTLSFLTLFQDGFQGWAKLVINAETNTLLGATFVGPEFSELVQAATLAIVAKIPVSLLHHAVAPHPTVNQVWDLLLAQESELAPLLKSRQTGSTEEHVRESRYLAIPHEQISHHQGVSR